MILAVSSRPELEISEWKNLVLIATATQPCFQIQKVSEPQTQGSHRSKNIKFKDFSRIFKDLLTHIQEPKCAKNICFKINVCFIMLLIMLKSPVTFRSIVS